MPRIALVCLCLVGTACSFDADYSGGTYLCGAGTTGECPSGLVCDTLQTPQICIKPRRDAAIDTLEDGMVDARKPALTCNDPGMFPPTGGSTTGNNATKASSMVSAQCSTGVMNGLEDVYKIEVPAGKQVSLAVSTTTGGYQVAAYMVTPCPSAACMSATYATPGNPATITTTIATPQFIVVDSIITNTGGNYTLDVTVN